MKLTLSTCTCSKPTNKAVALLATRGLPAAAARHDARRSLPRGLALLWVVLQAPVLTAATIHKPSEATANAPRNSMHGGQSVIRGASPSGIVAGATRNFKHGQQSVIPSARPSGAGNNTTRIFKHGRKSVTPPASSSGLGVKAPRSAMNLMPDGQSAFYIVQSWMQPEDPVPIQRIRQVHCLSITGSGQLRPIIYLHGSGGNGSNVILNHVDSPGYEPGTVVVAPDGYMNSWNAVAERTQSPDVDLVDQIIGRLSTFSNVDMTGGVTVIGFSNGCGLVQRLAVESSNTMIKYLGCLSTPLNKAFYRDKQFYRRPDENYRPSWPMYVYGFTQPTTPLVDRVFWSFHGKQDDTIPYDGGPALGGEVYFQSAPESVYTWASHYGGARGAGSAAVRDCAGYTIQSYLQGQVALFSWDGLDHDLPLSQQVQRVVRMLGHAATGATPGCVPMSYATAGATHPAGVPSSTHLEGAEHTAGTLQEESASSRPKAVGIMLLSILAPLLL